MRHTLSGYSNTTVNGQRNGKTPGDFIRLVLPVKQSRISDVKPFQKRGQPQANSPIRVGRRLGEKPFHISNVFRKRCYSAICLNRTTNENAKFHCVRMSDDADIMSQIVADLPQDCQRRGTIPFGGWLLMRLRIQELPVGPEWRFQERCKAAIDGRIVDPSVRLAERLANRGSIQECRDFIAALRD